jgi:hypothetical protein
MDPEMKEDRRPRRKERADVHTGDARSMLRGGGKETPCAYNQTTHHSHASEHALHVHKHTHSHLSYQNVTTIISNTIQIMMLIKHVV